MKSAWYVFLWGYFTYTGCSIPGVSYLVCCPWLCDSWDNIAGTQFLVHLLGAWYISPVGRLFPVYYAWHIMAVVRHSMAVVCFSWYIIPGINTAWYQVYYTWHVMPGVLFLVYIFLPRGARNCAAVYALIWREKNNSSLFVLFFFLSGLCVVLCVGCVLCLRSLACV